MLSVCISLQIVIFESSKLERKEWILLLVVFKNHASGNIFYYNAFFFIVVINLPSYVRHSRHFHCLSLSLLFHTPKAELHVLHITKRKIFPEESAESFCTALRFISSWRSSLRIKLILKAFVAVLETTTSEWD